MDHAQDGGALNAVRVARIFKRVAQWIGVPARFVEKARGYSAEVGTTQNLAALDIELAAVNQAGGWKSMRMPLQYAEKIMRQDQEWRERTLQQGETSLRGSRNMSPRRGMQ